MHDVIGALEADFDEIFVPCFGGLCNIGRLVEIFPSCALIFISKLRSLHPGGDFDTNTFFLDEVVFSYLQKEKKGDGYDNDVSASSITTKSRFLIALVNALNRTAIFPLTSVAHSETVCAESGIKRGLTSPPTTPSLFDYGVLHRNRQHHQRWWRASDEESAAGANISCHDTRVAVDDKIIYAEFNLNKIIKEKIIQRVRCELSEPRRRHGGESDDSNDRFFFGAVDGIGGQPNDDRGHVEKRNIEVTVADKRLSELLYSSQAMSFIKSVFRQVPHDSVWAKRKFNCVNPSHRDDNPSMSVQIVPFFWKHSKSIEKFIDRQTDDDLTNCTLDESYRHGNTRMVRISCNAVEIVNGDRKKITCLLFVCKYNCFACGSHGIMSNDQILELCL